MIEKAGTMSQYKRRFSWRRKFRDAGVGILQGIKGQSSFIVHLPMAAAVIGLGLVLRVPLTQFALLLICIAVVLSAELFNSSLEYLSRAVTDQYDAHIERALNIASGAVLVASILSAVIGLLILGPRLIDLLPLEAV